MSKEKFSFENPPRSCLPGLTEGRWSAVTEIGKFGVVAVVVAAAVVVVVVVVVVAVASFSRLPVVVESLAAVWNFKAEVNE